MRKVRFYLLIFLILIVSLLINSCSMKFVKVAENRKRLKLMLEEINKYNSSITSFKGIGYAILKDGKNTKTFRLDVVFNSHFKEYKVLIKDFIFKKQIAVLLKGEDGSILLYDYLKRKKSVYSNASDIFNKVLNIKIPEGNLFIHALGLKSLILKNAKSQIVENNSVQFYLNDLKEVISFQDGVPEKLSYTNGNNRMIIEFDKIKKVNSARLPSKILIRLGETTLEINYKDIQVNGDFTSDIAINKP